MPVSSGSLTMTVKEPTVHTHHVRDRVNARTDQDAVAEVVRHVVIHLTEI
jgi:hypothetical protein